MNSIHDVANKLVAARTKLILDKPFLGALVLRLPLRAANPQWCHTAATDARAFYYNPEYIDKLNLDQVQFVLAHEALHCALSHFSRRQHRHKYRWDIACDHAINPLLLKDGLKPPPGVWINEGFVGMTAEEIYPYIQENSSEEPMDQHIYDGESQGQQKQRQAETQSDNNGQQPTQEEELQGQGAESETLPENSGASQPPPLTDTEQQELSVQWRQRLAGAAQQALQAGKLGGALARMVDHLLQPQLPWRMLLARYLTFNARDDYTYQRPSRREGSAIFPSIRGAQVEMVIALDISGSVSDEEIGHCLAEINALKGQLRARITLLACDAELTADGPWIYEAWETFSAPRQFTGGGGTQFSPVFEYVTRQGLQPDLLVYFTDAEGEFPKVAPFYPVIWLVKGKGKVPWGQRIQLN